MKTLTYPPVGELYDVGGHRLHIHSTGEGSPSVILESGGASWSLDWHNVQSEVAKFTRVCSYDRAGFGWSNPGPKPRTSAQIVKELHALLEISAIAKPYILVGASAGGHTVRLYARQYPDEVIGLILLDARHESMEAKMPPAWKQMENSGKAMYRFLLLASRLKVLSLLGKMSGGSALPPAVSRLPLEIQPMYLEVGFQPKYFQANLDELEACTLSDQQLSAAGSLGDLPLTVIRHGIPDLFAKMPAGQAGQAELIWQELQVELSRRSTKGQLLVAEKSGHAIQIEQPELVTETIRQMVERSRQVPPPA